MDDLAPLRKRIDDIDAKIFALFTERAEVSDEIAAFKRAHGLAIFDPKRERAKVLDARSRVPEDLADQGERLMELLMESSRMRQAEKMQLDGAEKRYGLLGEHLGHSYSPQIHTALGSVPYDLFEVAPDDVERFIRCGRWDGINVTVPYKRKAAELADERSARVEALGAANTLIRRADGTIFAENTDVHGFEALLGSFVRDKLGKDAETAFSGRTVLVLGTGGAAQAVAFVLRETAHANVVFVSRSGPIDYANVCERCEDAALVVNTTPVGMYPNCPASPLSAEQLACFPQLEGIIDIIYNPRITGLCRAAEICSIPFASGLPMLVWQAFHSSELFQGRTLDPACADWIIAEIDAATTGIAIIGMPGSGKTTVGRTLAHILGRPFIDLDEAFTEAVGKTPAEVIDEQGEDAFRQLESQVCAECAPIPGAVIATGGGIVTRPGNYELLHQNSTIFFLDRPLGDLESDGRPLSQQKGIDALAQERMELYESWADHVIGNAGSALDAARAICDCLAR